MGDGILWLPRWGSCHGVAVTDEVSPQRTLFLFPAKADVTVLFAYPALPPIIPTSRRLRGMPHPSASGCHLPRRGRLYSVSASARCRAHSSLTTNSSLLTPHCPRAVIANPAPAAQPPKRAAPRNDSEGRLFRAPPVLPTCCRFGVMPHPSAFGYCLSVSHDMSFRIKEDVKKVAKTFLTPSFL